MSLTHLVHRATTRLLRLSGVYYAPKPGDVFLSSHPRSGNTWLRSIIAELMFGRSGERLHDALRYVPSVGMELPRWKVQPAPFHVVKTHDPLVHGWYLHEQYAQARVIYIMRDPRDVALSWHTFLTQQNSFVAPFDTFLEEWAHGRIWPGSWADHVNQWTGGRPPGETARLLVLRYEDLAQAPEAVTRKITGFLGLERSDEDIRRVLASASVDAMQKKEDRNKEKVVGFRSVNSGGAGKWRKAMTPGQVAQLMERSQPTAALHGYE